VRGYPRDVSSCSSILLIQLFAGAHVAFHGARFDRVRPETMPNL
jgi:hypothetical protein